MKRRRKMGRNLRFTLRATGMLMLLMGLLWIGQGAGLIHWPTSSFMIDQRPWVGRGALLALAGLLLIWLVLRRGR